MVNCGATDLPYEKQKNTLSSRMCGAAALCMVYRSFGVSSSQEEVWPAIARPPGDSEACARTYLLCADALRRGLAGLTLQVRHSVRVLQLAQEQGVRVILNHRPVLNSRGGHYSVLVAIGEDELVIHDPAVGPGRRLDLAHWLKLWRPGWDGREVPGNLAVFIAQLSPGPVCCRTCARIIPLEAECSVCHKNIPLRPPAVIGCVDSNCPERTWQLLFCPWCDAALGRLDVPA